MEASRNGMQNFAFKNILMLGVGVSLAIFSISGFCAGKDSTQARIIPYSGNPSVPIFNTPDLMRFNLVQGIGSYCNATPSDTGWSRFYGDATQASPYQMVSSTLSLPYIDQGLSLDQGTYHTTNPVPYSGYYIVTLSLGLANPANQPVNYYVDDWATTTDVHGNPINVRIFYSGDAPAQFTSNPWYEQVVTYTGGIYLTAGSTIWMPRIWIAPDPDIYKRRLCIRGADFVWSGLTNTDPNEFPRKSYSMFSVTLLAK